MLLKSLDKIHAFLIGNFKTVAPFLCNMLLQFVDTIIATGDVDSFTNNRVFSFESNGKKSVKSGSNRNILEDVAANLPVRNFLLRFFGCFFHDFFCSLSLTPSPFHYFHP